MSAGPLFPFAPECTCYAGRAGSVLHTQDCAHRHYVQGWGDGICAERGQHLFLEHLEGRCARCGRYENGTLPS